MAHRTTIKINDLIEHVNKLNRESTVDPKVRQGWNSLLEDILHQSNVYAGFGYLTEEQMQAAGHNKPMSSLPKQLPGIIRDEDRPENNQFPDETRRFYYHSSKLPRFYHND